MAFDPQNSYLPSENVGIAGTYGYLISAIEAGTGSVFIGINELDSGDDFKY
jgi:hypothetical protein